MKSKLKAVREIIGHGSARAVFLIGILLASSVVRATPPMVFDRDTFSFVNDTVFAYHDGHPSLRQDDIERYTARCFVMSRAVVQFKKFARFDPAGPSLDDAALAARIRAVTRRAPWRDALDDDHRVVISGVADLRTLSRTRPRVVQENIGLGWPTYLRPGNWRVLLPSLPGQRARAKRRLDRTLAQGGVFIAYITTLPDNVEINHAILVMSRRDGADSSTLYTVYDPSFPDAPRTLYWLKRDGRFWYPPNRTFVGGCVNVWQVYGAPLQ
jgi:hypothetical protein